MILPEARRYSHDELKVSAQRTANVYAEIANKTLGCNIPIPVKMDFNLCNEEPKCAGRASSTMLVEINMILFEDNILYLLNDTIPHEIGHLIQYDKFDLKGARVQNHGAEWQEIMRRLGKIPHKTHTLDTTRALAHSKAWKKANKKKNAVIE